MGPVSLHVPSPKRCEEPVLTNVLGGSRVVCHSHRVEVVGHGAHEGKRSDLGGVVLLENMRSLPVEGFVGRKSQAPALACGTTTNPQASQVTVPRSRQSIANGQATCCYRSDSRPQWLAAGSILAAGTMARFLRRCTATSTSTSTTIARCRSRWAPPFVRLRALPRMSMRRALPCWPSCSARTLRRSSTLPARPRARRTS